MYERLAVLVAVCRIKYSLGAFVVNRFMVAVDQGVESQLNRPQHASVILYTAAFFASTGL
jgi:hypothetical protein